jgi:hypothetical protein
LEREWRGERERGEGHMSYSDGGERDKREAERGKGGVLAAEEETTHCDPSVVIYTHTAAL